MYPSISQAVAEQHISDARRAADQYRLAAEAAGTTSRRGF